MKNASIKLLPLMFSLAVISGCGSSGGETSTIVAVAGDDAGASGVDGTNGTDSSGGADSSGSNTDGTADSTTDSGVASSEGDDSTGVVSNGMSDSVCAGISNEVTYELFGASDLSSAFGLYVPSLAPGVLGWDGSNYCDLTSSQGIEPISLLVPYSSKVPQVDGTFWPSAFTTDEWLSAAGASWSYLKPDQMLMRNLLVNTNSGYIDGARAADWQAMHDGTYLYIGVAVRNEGSNTGNPQVFLDSDDPVDDDSISIFIDGDNSKGSGYDGINDFHTTLAILDRTWTPEPGPNSALGLDISFVASDYSEDDPRVRLSYEVKIDMASAGIKVGVPFGFEIQLNEDDNGGPQDARFGWHEATGSAVAASNPSVFGTIVLTGCADNNNCNFAQGLNGQ